MPYQTRDGETIPHTDPQAVIAHLRQTSFSPGTSLDDFVTGLTHRVKLQTGTTIQADAGDYQSVVAGLVEVGLLTPVQ